LHVVVLRKVKVHLLTIKTSVPPPMAKTVASYVKKPLRYSPA